MGAPKLKKLIAAALSIAIPAGAAQAIPVSNFLQRADALKAKGMMALMSSDYKALKNEIVGASGALRQEQVAAKAAGRPMAYCPPGGKATLDSNEILSAFHTIPVAKQPQIDVKDALRSLLAHKYPCH